MPYKISGRKTKAWMGQKRAGDKKLRKSFQTKKEAIAWENEVEELLIAQTDMASLLSWATEYLDYANSKFVRKTYLGKRKVFKLLTEFPDITPNTPVTSLTPALFLRFLTQQFELSGGTAANNYRKDLHAAWEWGIDFINLPTENPLSRIRKFANQTRPRVVPSIDDFWKVYDLAEDQDKAMLMTFLHTAARRGEIYRLVWADIDFATKRIKLTSRKNREAQWLSRHVNMSKPLESTLKAHKTAHMLIDIPAGHTAPVFINYREGAAWVSREKIMPRLCQEAGVPPFGFHGIRHLAASILANNSTPLPEIQRFLGHGSMTTTEIYIKSLVSDTAGVNDFPDPEKRGKKPTNQAHKKTG